MLINIRNVAGNMLFTYPLGMFLLMHLIHASLPALKHSDAKSYDDDNKFMEETSVTLDGENVSAEINTKASIRSRTNTFSTVSTFNVNLTRQHEGDIFLATGVTSCDADICIGLSSGTAFWSAENTNKNDVFYRGKNLNGASLASSSSSPSLAPTLKVKVNMNGESCQCRCLPYLSTYREDLGICVDDIHECSLSPFVSGSSTEKIPFVFLPLKGQIIYPSREIRFPEIRMPVCAVTGAQYLTTNGWTDLRNPVDTNYPFRMFRDEGRTFLQWLGEADLRHKIQGRLIVVHLVCRDMSLKFNATNTPFNTTTAHEYIIKPRNVFTPCVAFRVNGSPVKYTNNVSEVSFQSETSSTLASATDGMSTKEYVVIGVCTLLLVLIYVSSVFLYLHMKKRKNRDPHTRRNSTLDDLTNEINYPKNDQVTFGAPFTRTGSLYSAGSLAPSNEPRSRNSLSSLKDDIGIVKNNPLLQHFPQLSETHSGFSSDISNSASECEMDGGGGGGGGGAGVYYDKKKQMQTNVLVHPQMAGLRIDSLNHSTLHMNNRPNHQVIKDEERLECTSSPSNHEKECLPAENVAIIEDLITEEKLETLRALANGNIRKKLYFNPSYFEPHLLAEPPAAALEFLQKIREVIAIAKYKMATKRYQPSLIMIPEEGAARSNTPSLYGSQLQNAKECHGCANNRCSGHVKNCGEKRNSIEKWLQTVHSTENANTNLEYRGNDSSRESTPAAHTGDVQKCTPANETFNLPKQLEKSNRHNNFHTPNAQKKIARKEAVPPKQKLPQPPLNKSSITNSSPTSSPLTTKSESCRNNSANAIQKESFHNDAPIYQACHTPHQLLQNSISLPIAHNKLENFSVLSKAANIYGYAETGSEIYNNPKFSLQDSPVASQKSRGSSYRSKESRKRLEVHEPFLTNPTANSTAHQHYDVVRSLQMEKLCTNPIKDACEPEYLATLPSNGSFHLNIPTPDYDSTMEKKDKDIYNNTQSSGPSVPTPDYSSLSRKSLKQYQPDSPIYRRKSPQYLIVDYETDSLERLEQTKRKNSSQSSSSPSSDVSSQLSPSLSTALPLEEELEITNTVFGDRFIGKTSTSQTKTSAVIAKKGAGSGTVETSIVNKAKVARIKYDTPFRGSMTIEVEHEPPSDLERSTDSDQYEPDTLDRKPKKQSFCDISNWPMEGLNQRQEHETEEATSAMSLPNIISVQASCKIKCSTEVSLQNGTESPYSQYEMRKAPSENNVKKNTAIYQSVLVRQNSDCSCKCGEKTNDVYSKSRVLTEKGRLLTLEAKHSRRQRPSEPSTPQLPEVDISKQCSNKTTIIISTPLGKNLEMKSNEEFSIDVRPETENSLEDSLNLDCMVKDTNTFQRSIDPNPTPSTKRKNAVSPNLLTQSQSNSANTTLSSKTGNFLRIPPKYLPYSNAEDETLSNHSQCTEITGISETIANSEFDGTIGKTLPSLRHQIANEDENLLNKSSINMEKVQLVNKFMDENYSAIFNTHINGLRSDYSLNKYMIRRKDKTNDDNNLDNDNISNVYADDENNIYDNDNQEIKRIANSNNEDCNILKNSFDSDFNRVDNVSLSSRSNRSSSRLSQRTKEMYRNAGVPVGIAYPQRSTSNTSIISSNSTNNNNNNINNNNNNTSSNNSNNSNVATAPVPTTNIQAVYRCEIEPVQLTHGMQIAMGLKDRPKKAKDLKNAWKKFVSMAAAKFSPTLSPTQLYDKNSSNFLDVLNKTENVPIIITNEQQQPQKVSSPNSYLESPASASQNYYEQRFGLGARSLQDIDSGYISTDSAEALKRGYYDRYNYRLITNRERIITVDTIEDNSDNDQASTNYEETGRLETSNEQINNGLDIAVNRYEECTGMENQELTKNDCEEECVDEQHSRAEASDDNDSNRTLTQSNSTTTTQRRSLYISDEEEPITTTSNGSSETDDEANADDMWESGAESVETHSVLYKNIRKPQQR